MNEQIKDAKYFVSRIGNSAWYRGAHTQIFRVSIYGNWFDVNLGYGTENWTVKNGVGITFEAPKKMVERKENVWFNYYPKRKYPIGGSLYLSKEAAIDGGIDNNEYTPIQAKLIFEVEE